jgi:hypothetical protein
MYDFPQYRLQAHDMQQLLLSCPNLQQLDLRGRIHGNLNSWELQPLLRLAGSLTSLSLGGGESDRGPAVAYGVCDGALGIICQLSCLESLTVDFAWKVTDVGLLSLCKLRQLRELQVLQLTEDAAAVSEALVPRMSRDGWREIKLSAKVGHTVTMAGSEIGHNSSSSSSSITGAAFRGCLSLAE